jgi:hydroxymethylglutaryl-CoA lyase
MPKSENIILVDCPRDAIQGIHEFIPTQKKIAHINTLIKSGLFDWIDFGSFVSPKAVPQLADTQEVLAGIELVNSTKLLAIIANERGAEAGVQFDKVHYLGYPFSISDEFQRRNTNSGVEESFQKLERMNAIVQNAGKEMVVYISMGFGNPYGDAWSKELVVDWIGKIKELGIKEFSLADTTSEATPERIKSVFESSSKAFPDLNIGVHLHSDNAGSMPKIEAAFDGGCRKFDGALLGYGGCPFANDDLVGNIPSEDLLYFFERGNAEQIFELQESFRSLINNSKT